MLNSLQYVNISSQWQYDTFAAKAFRALDNLKLKFQTAESEFKKEVLIPVWRGHNWMFDVRKPPGQSERVQNSRLTLSHWALWTLSHNSSPAVISSSSLPRHPLFSTPKTVSCRRERLKHTAKNNQQQSPREADIPRTSTSSVQSSVGAGWRTILWDVGD